MQPTHAYDSLFLDLKRSERARSCTLNNQRVVSSGRKSESAEATTVNKSPFRILLGFL